MQNTALNFDLSNCMYCRLYKVTQQHENLDIEPVLIGANETVLLMLQKDCLDSECSK